jgi:hypothetical protein
MEKYGLTEMIMEPAWEFNHDDYWGVSPAQQRSSTIGPYDYAYGMAALRLARDNVGIKCSLVSHILALHGDKWTDPNRETWKRTVVQPYFDGMKYADIVTVSLYLDASGWQSSWNTNKGPQPTTWQEYLAWIYTNVVGLQKGETGWAPALYVGTTEHNLDSGAVADTDVYAYDFNKFEMSGCSLFGWWIDFSSPSVRTFVNQQAQAMQARYPLGSQNPAENPVTTNNPTQPPYTSGSSQAEETAPPGSSLWPNLPFDSRTIAAAVLIAVVVGLVAFSILKKKKMG